MESSRAEHSKRRVESSTEQFAIAGQNSRTEIADVRRYETLAAMADVMVQHRSLPELFRELAERLHKVVAFELARFSLHDPHKNAMRVYVWEGKEPGHATTEVSVEDSPGGWVWQKQKMLFIPELQSDTRFEKSCAVLSDQGIRCYCALPLTTADRRLGALGIGSSQPNAYSSADLRFLSRVADLTALTMENALIRSAFQEENERLQALLRLSTELLSNVDLTKLLGETGDFLRRVFDPTFANVELYEHERRVMRAHTLRSSIAQRFAWESAALRTKESIGGQAFLHGQTKIHDLHEATNRSCITDLRVAGIQSLCSVPLVTSKGAIGALNLGSKELKAYTRRDIVYLKHLAAQLALALDNMAAYQEIAELTERLKTEKLYLEDEIYSVRNFEEIIGESPTLKRALSKVDTVAPIDTTVLILGETGTGKELIARAIHRSSSRKNASFIKLNCAAIPTGLLESELFGHEKGAFTGAVSQKIGRLELADKGTLFLDEVGDIPLELQPKLLRVLQDQEFERLGGTRTIKVDIRLIAATNRDLEKGVAAREFRSDLYYRLHVFPIKLPPLRERTRDIPDLVRYFVRKFSARMNKHIENIPTHALNALASWYWPGNVRELENFIERSVILTEGATLNVPISELKTSQASAQENHTLASLEREHILRVLRETGGVIAGVHGAAARLGMKRTTLQSRMQKMGISRDEFQN